MAEIYNAKKGTHRIRTRLAEAHGVEWELLQTFLGFAFTVQQEKLKGRLVVPLPSDSLAEGLHPALERIASCARNLTEATGAAIALGGPDAMVCVARSGNSAPPLGARFDASSGLSGECIRTGESAICVNAAADPRVNYQACRALNIASMLYFPLRSPQGKMIGMLGVFSSRPLQFSRRDISCLRFTEGLVQEAIGRSIAGPDPATLAVLLRQADFASDGPEKLEEPAANIAPEPQANVSLTPSKSEPAPSIEPPKPLLNVPQFAPTPRIALPPLERVTPVPRLEPQPIFVGRIEDEAVQDVADISLDPLLDEEIEHRSRIPAVLALLAALIIAVAAWHYNFLGTSGPEGPQQRTAKTEPTPAPPPVLAPAPSEATSNSGPPERALTSAVSLRSGDATASVTVLLPKAIRFEGYQLTNPDRIYFDLHDIKLTDAKGNVFKNDEGLISRVRLSNYGAGITRVVFDLRQPATFEARLAEKPERLLIEMRKTTPASKARDGDSGVPTKVTIVIDPGHGGKDLGTVSSSGLQEKDLTLDVALRLGALLKQKLGANVIFTRDKDDFVTLDDRASIANQAHADFMISIHGNSSSLQSVRGIETYYFSEPSQAIAAQDQAETARAFAADVHRALINGLGDPHQPMRDRGVKEASFVVLREAQMPAALAEISFISNQKDEPRLESAEYRQQIARALFRGIANHVARSETRTTSLTTLRMQRLPGTP